MKGFLTESKINFILTALVILLAVVIGFQSILSSCNARMSDNNSANALTASEDSASTIDQVGTVAAVVETTKLVETTEETTTEPTEATTQSQENPNTDELSQINLEPTEDPTEATTATEAETIQWATVMTMETSCPYQDQWDEGYIVAIDYPDKTYKTTHVSLTAEDRDILEHLCMGEFGSGGFIGAALIAQCVKDAMCFDGYSSVEAVRVGCRYDGSLDNTPSQEVKNAVSYIFDGDHAAVQHRMMYMYNPVLVQSQFHESQNYILTYQDVRFFDRWGY